MSSLATLQRISLRSLFAHKLRLLLTVLAVVLGTSFVSGGFILTATLSKAFEGITEVNYQGVDVVLDTSPEVQVTFDMAKEIRGRGDVALVETTGIVPVIILDSDDNPLQTGGAGSWLLPYTPPEEAVSPAPALAAGSAPTAKGHAVLNESAAESAGIGVGETVTAIDQNGRQEFIVDGLTSFDSATGGWAGLQIPADYFRSDYTDGTHIDRIGVRSRGVEPEILRDSLAEAYPGASIKTGVDAAADETAEISSQLAFFTWILLAFGLIALLVGAFIISNTFSMTIAQRTREFALLRAFGMSRPQVSGSVLVEAALIGVLGSVLGVVAGFGLVKLIMTAMEVAGFGFPNAGLGSDPLSILAPVAIGVGVTIVSAWVPARRAGRIHPIEAMRSGDQSITTPLKSRTIGGSVVLIVGLAASAVGALGTDWSTSTRGILVGVGAAALILGVLSVSALLARELFSSRIRLGGVVALLSRTNLSRNPRRTAATAFALTLGVALVVAVGILGASMKESIFGHIDETLKADAVVATSVVNMQSIPAQAVRDLAGLEGISTVMPVTWVAVEVNGEAGGTIGTSQASPLMSTDPRSMLALEVIDGSFDEAATTPGVGLSRTVSERMGRAVGDTVTVSAPSLTSHSMEVPVLVIWEDNTAYTPLAIAGPTGEELIPHQDTWYTDSIFVTFEEDADTAATLDAVTEKMNSYGVLQVMDRYQYRNSSADQVNQLMSIVYALLALSVVIAVLGIVNTLALSITERTREFGTLRSVGTQRSQIRRMILLEAIQIAVLGAATGVVVGVWLGWCFVRILADQGIDRLLIPWDQVAWVLFGAVIVGAVAGLWPSRQASRTLPLAAVG